MLMQLLSYTDDWTSCLVVWLTLIVWFKIHFGGLQKQKYNNCVIY